MIESTRQPFRWNLLDRRVAAALDEFANELLLAFGSRCGSLAVVGSSASPDYLHERSDLNTVLFLDQIRFDDLDTIAPLGVKYGPRLITAPLLFTVPYVQSSLDSFPIEFLNLQLEHATVWGRDLLGEYSIEPMFLRLAVERELKGSVLQLQQYWIRAAGRIEEAPDILQEAFTALTPVFRGLLALRKIEVPKGRMRLLSAIGTAFDCDISPFQRALDQRVSGRRMQAAEVRHVVPRFLSTTQRLADQVDRMSLDP